METTMKKMVKVLAAAALFAAGVAIARAAEPVVVSAAPAPKIAAVEPVPAEGGQASTEAAKDDLFAGTEVFEKNASDVNEVTMDPDTLAMVGGKDEKKAHGMVLNVVRSYEYDKPGMYNMADVDRFRQKLNTGDWHCSIHTRDLKTGESSDICQKRRTDGLREQAIITVEPKQLTFIHTIMRGYGPGSSEMGGMSFGSFAPMGSFSSLAAINSAQFAAMEDSMARLQSLGPKMQAEMGILRAKRMQDGQQFKSFDKGKMKVELDKEVEKAQKEKHKAEREAEQESSAADRDAAKAKAEAEKQQQEQNSNQPQ